MARQKKREKREGPLEKKWRPHSGTGITANKGKNSIALREAVGGGEFAIVKLYGGCSTGSRLEVIEEIQTSNLEVAKKRFNAIAKKLGFKVQPIRTVGVLFDFLLFGR